MLVDDIVVDGAHRRDAIHYLGATRQVLANLHSRHRRIDARIVAARFLRLGIAQGLRVPGVDLCSPTAEPDVNDMLSLQQTVRSILWCVMNYHPRSITTYRI